MKNEEPMILFKMVHPLALIIHILCVFLCGIFKDSIILIILSIISAPFAALYVLKANFFGVLFTSNKKSKK